MDSSACWAVFATPPATPLLQSAHHGSEEPPRQMTLSQQQPNPHELNIDAEGRHKARRQGSKVQEQRMTFVNRVPLRRLHLSGYSVFAHIPDPFAR
jgi:hypothetical protein